MQKYSAVYSLASLFLTILLSVSQAKAQLEVPPQLKWKTLKTAHFEVIFNAEQQDLGYLYAEKLEKAYSELRSYFHSRPDKTIVIINDKTDVTNGYATRIPYPHIMAYPVLPGPEESLSDTGDWAFELLAHEYTHILTFEPANGIMKPLRAVFGTIIAPNILMPQWWKEGVAVEMETRLSDHGRLRSHYQDATVRAMVDAKTLRDFDIAEANENIYTWPQGARPYLFGSLMWSQMIADKGTKVVGELHERQGGRVPYFIETPARDYLGASYSSEYDSMMKETELRALEQLKTLREISPTATITPQNNFQSVSAPAISPDGKHLALITEDDGNSRAVKILTKEKDGQSFLDSRMTDTIERFNESFIPATQKDGPPTGSIQRISWFPDSKRLIYDKIDYTNRIQRYSDLFVYELGERKAKALTKGLRGREPAVSPSGNQVVFVKLDGNRTHLGLIHLATENNPPAELLFSPPMQQRVSYPTFLDEDTIVFSLRTEDGRENLHRYSISSKTSEAVLTDYPNARFARKTTEGVIFASAKNGVPNLYLSDVEFKNVRPISHTLTALFTADMDPLNKEIFATEMTSQGLRVSAIKPDEWQKTPNTLPQVSSLMGDRYAKAERNPQAEEEARNAVKASELDDYSPYGYLLPRYWMPFISGSSSETGLVIEAQTSGFDPLKKHMYEIAASWDTGINKGSILGSYINQTTPWPFAVLSYKRSYYLGTVSNEIEDFGAQLSVLPDTHWASIYSNLQVGWQYLERTTLTTEVKRTGPYAYLSYANYSQSGAQISPESGGGAYLGAYNYIAQEGYLNHSQFLAGGEIYLSRFLPKHHAIMLRLNGVYTPEKVSPIYGVSTESMVFIPNSPLPQYILRGYKRGQLFGRNLVTVNAEYRLPLKDLYRGSGTDALFLRRLSAAVVGDAAAAEGRFVNDVDLVYEVTSMNKPYYSAGVEAKLETTLGYVIPVNVVLGYYVAFQAPKGPEGVLATALQITGF
ncbi:TolB family protein [Bdellovibrio bacteriovorus]|uniref:TolB protein n=1 Tax=Bdellovibrio bacteriovorus TaxID=959 RepID=A0A1Z3NBI1_BDEBC|nr:hypothetical protein [Bdellovibrio bacteriovorus]ASD64824.1 hypothetical protein B9G79_15270 [Bdellovibrio bacteriovorus]